MFIGIINNNQKVLNKVIKYIEKNMENEGLFTKVIDFNLIIKELIEKFFNFKEVNNIIVQQRIR